MSSLELPTRSLVPAVVEGSICLVMNITSVIGNVLVCLAVYKNPKLRSPTILYITAFAASDLLCATVEMPLVLAALITGRRIFGHAVCEFQGFVVAFVVYSTPATVGLLALNRYIRIVKSNYY